MIGQVISHYRVIEQIGAGGMGVVYRAEDTRLGRPLVLKFLPPALSRDPMALERFEREARTASSMNHPGICTVYDIGEFEGQRYIAMEYLDGQPLDRFIGGKPVPLSTLLDLSYQQRYVAPSGGPGQTRDKYGKAGADTIVRVPVGTVVKDDDSGELLADLTEHEQRFVAAQGGKGGRGNIHFATSTNQSPSKAEEGTAGEERTLRLDLSTERYFIIMKAFDLKTLGKNAKPVWIVYLNTRSPGINFTTAVGRLGHDVDELAADDPRPVVDNGAVGQLDDVALDGQPRAPVELRPARARPPRAHHAPLPRDASYSAIAPAAATFSDSAPPGSGIVAF